MNAQLRTGSSATPTFGTTLMEWPVNETISARGRVPLRVGPELNRAAAQADGKSLNAWLANTIEQAVDHAS